MTSLKNLFNFVHDQGRLDMVGSSVAGVAMGGCVAAIAGFAMDNMGVALFGLTTQLATIALATPLFAGSLEKFHSRSLAVSTALTVAGIFGLSAAVSPWPESQTPPSHTQSIATPKPAAAIVNSNHAQVSLTAR